MAKKKTPGRKAPAKKVAAVQRLREHKAKKRPEPAHVFEDVPPAQPEFDFTKLGEAKCTQAAGPEPSPVECLEKAMYGLQEEVRNVSRSVVPQAYRDAYGPEGNCGDMVALILASRSQDDIEMYVYEKTGKAWPGVNAGMRRMNAGNVIRGLVNRQDVETMAWLLATLPR